MKKLIPLALSVVVCVFAPGLARAACPATPTLVSPVGGTTVPFGTVELKWNAASGATNYEILMGLDGDAPSSVDDTVIGTSRKVAVDPGRDVKWKVYAKNLSCPAGTSSTLGEFFTSCPTNPPTLRDPDKNAIFPLGENITFRWTSVAGATSYDVNVTPDFGQTWKTLKEFVEGTSFTTNDIGVGDWGWNVRANFDSCDPLYSEPSNFFVTDCPKDAPELTQPNHGEADVQNPVELRWNVVDGATKYKVYVSIDGGSRTLAGETTETKLLVSLSGKEVLWQVEALLENCSPLLSNIRSFTLAGAGGCPSSPGKATLVSPAAGASNLSSPVTFKWNAVSGATGYRVWVLFSTSSEDTPLGFTTDTDLTADVPAGSGVWFVQTLFGENCPATLSDRRALTVTSGAQCENVLPQLEYPPNGAVNVESPVEFRWSEVKDATKYSLWVAAGNSAFAFYGSTEDTSLERLVPDGTVQWFVVAQFAACPEVRSATGSFQAGTLDNCPGGTIELTAPANDTEVSSPVHLAWAGIAGLEGYRVWIAVGDGAPVGIARTSATAVDVSLPAGQAEWYVEGLRTGCRPILSNKGRFTIRTAANCEANQPPELVSPVELPEIIMAPASVESPVRFEWKPAPGAIAYRLWLIPDGEPAADVGLTAETSLSLELEPGSYAWYVEALFNGCPPVKSQTAVFTVRSDEPRCPTAPPVPILPPDGASVTTPAILVWGEVDKASKYRLFASRNGGEPLLLGVTSETSLERTLPPGEYVWSVDAVVEECPSVTSPKRRFTVQQASNCSQEKPVLVSPPNGSTGVSNPVTFSWNPVSGAIKYVLFLRADEGAATAVASTTGTSVSRPVPAGRIEWWVVAVFAGCEPVKSEEFAFIVSRGEPCSNQKPIILSPDDENVASPAQFAWTPVANASGYQVWAWKGDDEPAIIAATEEPKARVELAQGSYRWFVEALVPIPITDPQQYCPARSATAEFAVGDEVACGTPRKPVAKVIGRTASGNPYRVRWSALPNVERYELQESTSLDFSAVPSITTGETSYQFSHEAQSAPVQYLYRVRGVSNCNDTRGPYSNVVGIFVFPPQGPDASAEAGSENPIVQKLFLPGSAAPLQFVATADQDWITISPPNGTLPPEGITLTITTDPAFLDLGTSRASISIVYSGAGKGLGTLNATPTVVPFSVSLVTPVEPGGKGTPSPDTLVFPVVAHVNGANNSFFESDVRLTNLTAEIMRYDIHFTPSGEDGTVSGSSSTIEVEPGATIALDDVLSSFFGEGTTTGAFGVLEVRPKTTSEGSGDDFFSSLTADAVRRLDTAASSRTYTFTPAGTYGQFIPAIPYSDFVGSAASGSPATVLSLQQVAESAAYRANFGFAEASGNPADLVTRVYDAAGTLLATIPVSLGASQHQQLNGMLSANGIQGLDDGRVEVEVVGGTGKVTAYVSEVDNTTNDPLLVSAEPKGSVTSDRYVVPGAGYVNNGSAFWVTDLRVFNAGSTTTPATLTFHPMKTSPGTTESREITLAPGEIEVIDNVLGDLFAQPNGAAGSVAITTPATTTLTATARTYNQTASGTYGQYIPGVTPAQSIGLGDRALQILQVEQSSRFRTNIGLAETNGAPATVEVMGFVPDSLVTAVTTVPLAANEFFQFPLSYLGLGDSVYNARVSVRVVDGAGRITAYGSAIDAITQDPTYVPAQ